LSLDLTQNIRRHGFKRLLLAVSGGLDSICLAHYFIANRDALGIEWLGIAHVHHGLREGTADRDAAFVEAFARKQNVPFFLKKLDGDALKNAEGSLEENAREARYKALVEIALDPSASPQDDAPRISYPTSSIINHPSSIIVTAHHAGDQAETMYMRLRRGTMLAGLRGIQEIRILGNSQGVAGVAPEAPLEGVMEDRATGCNQGDTSPTPHIINHQSSTINHPSSIIHHFPHLIYRPFLSVSREDLLAYARENNLEWCEDESNDDVKFARNKVRHETLPRLEQECPGATEQLCRMAEIADRAYAKVMEKCGNLFEGACTRVMDPLRCAPGMTKSISLNNKTLRKVLLEHANADLSELFRLWLSEQGLRFPIGFFYGESEPAHVKILHRAAYRRRSIAKIGHTVQICEFFTPEEAQKFVSCREKDKGL
jgi:tRNA(Ile)-lysidine synthase